MCSLSTPWRRLLLLVLLAGVNVSWATPGRKGNSLSDEVDPPAPTKKTLNDLKPTFYAPTPIPAKVKVTPGGREAAMEVAQEPFLFQHSQFPARPMAVQLFGDQRPRVTVNQVFNNAPQFVSARELLVSPTPPGVAMRHNDEFMIGRPTVHPRVLNLRRRAHLYHLQGRFLRRYFSFKGRTTPAPVVNHPIRTRALARRFIRKSNND